MRRIRIVFIQQFPDENNLRENCQPGGCFIGGRRDEIIGMAEWNGRRRGERQGKN